MIPIGSDRSRDVKGRNYMDQNRNYGTFSFGESFTDVVIGNGGDFGILYNAGREVGQSNWLSADTQYDDRNSGLETTFKGWSYI